MSWTFTVNKTGGGTATMTLPDAEFGDIVSHVRRQATAVSDGGTKFVQDLKVEDEFIDAQWIWLDDDNRSDILIFIRAADFQSKPFSISITGSRFPSFPVGLNTGQSIEGSVINTGDDPVCSKALNTGQTVRPDTAFLTNVFFENPDFVFEQVKDGRSQIAMRFRIPGGPIIAEA